MEKDIFKTLQNWIDELGVNKEAPPKSFIKICLIMKSRRSKATDILQSVKEKVWERDKYRCIK